MYTTGNHIADYPDMRDDKPEPIKCEKCDGDGKEQVFDNNGEPVMVNKWGMTLPLLCKCPHCNGEGYFYE